jgi:subtilisin family serine protease
MAAIALLLCPTLAAAAAIQLRHATFDPLRGEAPMSRALSAPGLGRDQLGYFVLQLRGPLQRHWGAELDALQVERLGYVPDFAFLARLPAARETQVRQLEFVRWLGPFHPAYRISPELGRRSFQDPQRQLTAGRLLSIEVFPGVDVAEVAARAAAASAGLVLMVVDQPELHRFELLAPGREAALTLAQIADIQWIDEPPERLPRNNTTRWVIQTNSSNDTSIWDHGLHGEGQVIGHIDGKIKDDSCYFEDLEGDPPGPNHRKLVSYHTTSAFDDSHGTHTAGTAAGLNSNNSTNNAGHAYMAKIAHSDFGYFSGRTLFQLLDEHFSEGARVHTNSWGDDGTTAYTQDCVDIDNYSWQREDGLVLFAETNLNVSPPKTPENAKNVVAVGNALQAPNQHNRNGCGIGPTADGRRKPEIYSPGTNIVSAGTGSCSTTTFTGTSMACPATTGAAALIRQYFTAGYYPAGAAGAGLAFTPTGALIKATLLNGTVDMTGVTGYPSNAEGWGRTLLENALHFSGDSRQLVVRDLRHADGGLGTGELKGWWFTVLSNGESLRVTMVFTDPPGTLNASNPVVNNLDLEVVAPDGTVYKGNVIDTNTGNSIPGGSPDPKNNVEMVLLNSPAAGGYRVRVVGTAVNQGDQGFALAITGDLQDPLLLATPRLVAGSGPGLDRIRRLGN